MLLLSVESEGVGQGEMSVSVWLEFREACANPEEAKEHPYFFPFFFSIPKLRSRDSGYFSTSLLPIRLFHFYFLMPYIHGIYMDDTLIIHLEVGATSRCRVEGTLL